VIRVAVLSLVVAAGAYIAWIATVDDSTWGTITGAIGWVAATTFVISSATLFLRVVSRRRRRVG
jgi:hypothetical protein